MRTRTPVGWHTLRVTENRLTTLLNGRPALFDGGYGWLLQDRGLPAGLAAEVWNLENPDAIEALHEEYAVAGAQFLTTNTFGGTRARLEMNDLGDKVAEVNEAAAAIARRVADRHGILVAGDVGPSGELLEPLGIMTEDDATAMFAEQIAGLAAGGADVILIETMSDPAEAACAIAAAKTAAPELPLIVTMSFDTNLRTMMGTRPADAVTTFAALGVDAVGANCGRGPEEMIQIAAQLQESGHEDVLLVAQSNAGLPQVVGDGFEYTVDPAGMADHAVALRDLGIDVIGACCGSSPDHVKAMADALAQG